MNGSIFKYFTISILSAILSIRTEKSVAQGVTISKKRYLTIGDTIPDISMKMFNYTDSLVKPSDFRGKLLILDIWATWCKSCVENFPKMQSLQAEFGDAIQILPIALNESEDVIKKFYKKRKDFGREIYLPTVVDDSLMTRQFYFKTISHVVWINQEGIIMAITGSRPVNHKIIQRILHGENVKLPLKYLDPAFDESKPLLVFGNGGNDTSFTVRSLFTRYKPHIRNRSLIWSSSSEHFFSLRNRNALQMYTEFYGHLSHEIEMDINLKQMFEMDYLKKRVLIECSKEKIKNWPVPTDIYKVEEYSHRYRYCYELNLPPSYTRKQALEKAIDDLDFFLQVKSEIDVREVECLALVRINKNKPIGKSIRGHIAPKVDRANDSLQIANMPMITLSKELTQRGRNLPIIFDETGYKDNINMQIAFAKYTDDTAKLNSELSIYNLVLVPKKSLLKVLVIKDRNEL